MSKKIVVIGGGISGLSASYSLMKAGMDVTCLEKNTRCGGAIKTGQEEGYLFECGPNSTMNSNDEIDSLCRELGLEEERVFGSEISKKRYVMKGGRLIHLPMGLADFLGTPLWSFGGKMRLLKEPFAGKSIDAEESVASFVARRIGKEMLDYALDPFVSGVYAGDPGKLELRSTFPKMNDLESEYGSLILGAIKKGLKGGKKSSRRKGIFSFKSGMSALPEAIVKALGERFQGGVSVEAIEKKDDSYLVKTGEGKLIEANQVVLSSPAYVNAEILSALIPDAAQELAQIDYAPIAVVYLGFEREKISHPLDGFGCLIPSKENKKLLGSLWSSSLFPGRAPEGMASLTCFMGGAKNRSLLDKKDDEIREDVLTDLKPMLHISGNPSFSKIIRHKKAIPQYNIGHGKRLERIENALCDFKGLHLLGNYLKGVSVADCVMNGVNLAKKITPQACPA